MIIEKVIFCLKYIEKAINHEEAEEEITRANVKAEGAET